MLQPAISHAVAGVTPFSEAIECDAARQDRRAVRYGSSAIGHEICIALSNGTPTEAAIATVAGLLAKAASSGLAYDLQTLLADKAALQACAAASYLHGNGFYKIVLSESQVHKLRLHVWLPGVDAEENIHEHRWHFASTVLTGALYSEIYAEDVTSRAIEYDEYTYLAKEGTSPPRQTHIGKTKLVCVRANERRAGDFYSMVPNVMHRIVRTNGNLTATLMCQSAPSRRWNRLITQSGKVADVAQRYMTATEVADVVCELLKHLGNH